MTTKFSIGLHCFPSLNLIKFQKTEDAGQGHPPIKHDCVSDDTTSFQLPNDVAASLCKDVLGML